MFVFLIRLRRVGPETGTGSTRKSAGQEVEEDEYTDQDVGKGRRNEEGGRNGGGSDSSEEFGGMVGIARKVEGVTHEKILQALIFERRQYVNLMCKYPLTCNAPSTTFSSPLDRHVAKRVEVCRFGESRCFAGSRCFGCLNSPGRFDESSRIRGISADHRPNN